jgi:hypothetical protein
MKISFLFCIGTVVLMLSAASAQSGVVWTFIETSCISGNGGCQNLNLPAPVAQLSLPDINSSGHYLYETPPVPPIEMGDTDFFLSWGIPAIYAAPVVKGGTPALIWDIAFASSAIGLGISIEFLGLPPNSGNIDVGTIGGSIGADGLMPGCGLFAQCSITGFWTLTSVPEPSSFVLVSALGVIFLLASRTQRLLSRGV